MARFVDRMAENGFPRIALRDRAQVAGQFAGLDLLDPGVVPVSRWRPDTDAEASAVTALWGGVARKP
jgi:hypothetical protein